MWAIPMLPGCGPQFYIRLKILWTPPCILYTLAAPGDGPKITLTHLKFLSHYVCPPSILTNSCKGHPHPNPVVAIRASLSPFFFVQPAFFLRSRVLPGCRSLQVSARTGRTVKRGAGTPIGWM